MTSNPRFVLFGTLCLVLVLLFATPYSVSASTTTTTSTTSNLVQGGIAGGDPTCSLGSICTFTLTVENAGSTGLATLCPGAEASVVINNTHSPTIITVTSLQGSSLCAPSGVGKFGYNDASSTFASVACGSTDVTSDWSSVGPKTVSQFGTFNNVFANPSSKCTSVTFTLDSLVTSYGTSTGSNPGYVFAVHAIYSGGTGYVATPMFPLGTVLAVLAPLAALGLYFGSRRGFKL